MPGFNSFGRTGLCLSAMKSMWPMAAQAEEVMPPSVISTTWVVIFGALCPALASVEQSRARQSGAGLWLPPVQSFISLHGGDAALESGPGVGT